MSKNYTYICPNCKTKMDYVGQAQRGTILYHYIFHNQNWEQDDVDDAEHLSLYCPSCGKDLPPDLEKEIWKEINKT